MPLDDEQKRAAEHFKGPAVIIAGPGSGKTTVITNRIVNLINRFNVSADKILVITFTRMAAGEMKERFYKLWSECGENTSYHKGHKGVSNEAPALQGVTFGTFHSVFFMMLKRFFNYKADDIITGREQRRFLREELIYNEVSARDESGLIEAVLSEIARVKSICAERGRYKPSSCEEELFWRLYSDYCDFLSREHIIDFEDMMLQTRSLLKERKDALDFWQERYEYILVDEFQDVSPVQLEIVRMLSGKRRNIFVVGDDDQSIYGFRGSAPGVMREFIEYFPDAELFRLDVNYRCSGRIVGAAACLIGHNKDRFFKNLRAYNTGGAPIEYLEFDSIDAQEEYIAESLRAAVNSNKFAVLTRTNAEAARLVSSLSKRGVEAACGRKKSGLYEHWIALDILAYIRIAAGKTDRAWFLRILNKPVRYVSRLFLTEDKVDLAGVIKNMTGRGQLIPARALERLSEDIDVLAVLPPFAAVNYIRKAMGYDLYITEYAKEKKADAAIFFKVLDALQADAGRYENISGWLAALDKSKENYGQSSPGDLTVRHSSAGTKKYSEGVSICTMHAAKGLEFDNVIITSVNEGIVPCAGTEDDDNQLEEERRLFYVAVTRAKKRLTVCHVRQRYNKKMQPSRFLAELRDINNL